jgi:hypothetical protein
VNRFNSASVNVALLERAVILGKVGYLAFSVYIKSSIRPSMACRLRMAVSIVNGSIRRGLCSANAECVEVPTEEVGKYSEVQHTFDPERENQSALSREGSAPSLPLKSFKLTTFDP